MGTIDLIQNLNDEIKKCKKCRLTMTRTNVLCGEGDLCAELMLIAQAPGEQEDKEDKMFIGPSGEVLDELLKIICIDRKENYMTNLIKCMLPKNRKPKSDEVASCSQYLDREIDLIHPGMLAPLGYYAAVKSGAIKRFVVMAGCDGRQKARSYYTEVAENLPKDTVILTAGCAKYRYNKLALGDIGGIPRVLDAGQCNDSYSLAVIALKLKEVFGLEDINDLPISYDIAWYEQKAVAVLLALLYLGVKGIRLGPTLPAFISPTVLKVLVEKFDIKPIGEVKADVVAMMTGRQQAHKKKVV